LAGSPKIVGSLGSFEMWQMCAIELSQARVTVVTP